MQKLWGWNDLVVVLGLLLAAPVDAQVRGYVDGTFSDGSGGFFVRGWACQTGHAPSINVHMYVGGPAGSGIYVGAATANLASEAAVATACQTTGTAYRYTLPLTSAVRQTHGGKSIHVHGLSPLGTGNPTLTQSGVYLVPRPIAAIRRYTYNANQELCKVSEPEAGVTVMAYDGAGNLAWSAGGLTLTSHNSCNEGSVPAARKALRTYDARNRLKTLMFADGQGNQAWTYAPDGLPAQIATDNPNVATPILNTYAYNRRRLMTSETTKISAPTYMHQYNYNANGHLANMVYGSGLSVDYAPNGLGQATKVSTFATGVSYFPNGAVKQFTYGNGITHALTQNARGLPDTSCDFYGTCNAGATLNDGYDYDQSGNVLAISDGRTGARGNRSMTYDPLDRLIGVTTVSAPSFFGNATYTYDVLDNLTRTRVTAGNQPRDQYYCYNANWQLAFLRSGPTCTGNASPAVMALEYDLQGNVDLKNAEDYQFDLGNRLRRVVNKEWYAYDGHGRRVLSCTPTACDYQQYGFDGRLYFHRDNRAAKEFDKIYLSGSLVAVRERPTAGSVATIRYQHTDALGTPVAETDSSRVAIERTENEPYGRPANRGWRDGAGYTGHAEDAATKLNYMQQRYYDPQIGLFLSVDPVTAYSNPVGQFHRYRYANNNPYKFVDPDGRQSCNGTTCHLTDVNQLPGYAVIVTATAVSDFINTIFPIIPLAAQVSRSQSSNADDAPGPDGGSKPGDAFPDRPLPRGSGGEPAPDPEANGPHTQLGRKEGRNGSYPQAREFDGNGKPVRDVDFTDHGRPGNHTNPHEHPYIDNPTGGTPQRGPSRPLPENERPAR